MALTLSLLALIAVLIAVWCVGTLISFIALYGQYWD